MGLYGAGYGGGSYATIAAWRRPLSGQIRSTTPVTLSWWFAGYTNTGNSGMMFIIDPVSGWGVGGVGGDYGPPNNSILCGQFNNSIGSAYLFSNAGVTATQTWQHLMGVWDGSGTPRM